MELVSLSGLGSLKLESLQFDEMTGMGRAGIPGDDLLPVKSGGVSTTVTTQPNTKVSTLPAVVAPPPPQPTVSAAVSSSLIQAVTNPGDKAALLAGRYSASSDPARADGFNLAYYLQNNMDVTRAGIGGEYHYNNSGKREGRHPNAAAAQAAIKPPTAPTITGTTGAQTEIVVNFNTVSGQATDVQLATNAGFTAGVRTIYSNGSNVKFTGLAPATPYFVRLQRIAGNVRSAWTSPRQVNTSSLPAPVITTIIDADRRNILQSFFDYNKQYGYTWEQKLQAHLDWSKDAVNAAADPKRRTYAVSIGYDPARATADAQRLGVLPKPAVVPNLPPTITKIEATEAGIVVSFQRDGDKKAVINLATETGFTKGLKTITSLGTSVMFTGLVPGTTYYIRAASLDSANKYSPNSPVRSVVAKAAGVPVKPVVTVVTDPEITIAVPGGKGGPGGGPSADVKPAPADEGQVLTLNPDDYDEPAKEAQASSGTAALWLTIGGTALATLPKLLGS